MGKWKNGWFLLLPVMMGFGGCAVTDLVENVLLEPLEPRDFLKPPKILDSSQEFGFLHTVVVTVPADRNIYLAKAEPDVELIHPSGSRKDTVELNAPVPVLEGMIEGGEVLDIFATGNARNVPVNSINFGPNGSGNQIQIEGVLGLRSMNAPIGALVGLFDNEKQAFIIGQRKQINVPKGARILYLGVFDFPGYSSDNQGEYIVNIDVIRR